MTWSLIGGSAAGLALAIIFHSPAAPPPPDFDGDGFDDLVVPVSKEDVGTLVDAGSVNVLYGSAAGIV